MCSCAGVLTIEAARYSYRVHSLLLRWHSGHRGGHNTGCQLAQAVVAVTAFQPASAKCLFADGSLCAATSYCTQSLAAACCHRNCTSHAMLRLLCIRLVIEHHTLVY